MLLRKAAESSIDRLEREANDDFRLLADLGPEEFGIEHLIELRDRTYWRLAQFKRLQRLNLLLGATSAGWMLFGGLSAWAGLSWLAYAAFGVMGLSILSFLAGAWFLKVKYDNRGELEATLRGIEDELRRRAAKRGRSAHFGSDER